MNLGKQDRRVGILELLGGGLVVGGKAVNVRYRTQSRSEPTSCSGRTLWEVRRNASCIRAEQGA